jgi:probable phosphoglycerate mutase
MAEVVLIRPGFTDFDDQKRIQGTLDLPLNARGEEQAAQLAEQLRSTQVELVYTAPCEPARATAKIIGDELGLPVKELEGFRNYDQGLWQGLVIDDVRRKFPKVFKQWHESPEAVCPPEGETVEQVLARLQKSLRKTKKKKTNCAIIASEPLATLISCILKECKPELPLPNGRKSPLESVEIFQWDGESSGLSAVNGSAAHGETLPEISTHGGPAS